MKRVFGIFEAAFDGLYLLTALSLGCVLLWGNPLTLPRLTGAGMAFILVAGDACHLLPRIAAAAIVRQEEPLRAALGRGKQIASITMTVFYLLLWHLGTLVLCPGISPAWTVLMYGLAAVRIALCLLPQNRWEERYPPVRFTIWRNIPFSLMGVGVAVLYGKYAGVFLGLRWMWVAVVLSFLFYLPVVLWSNNNPKLGMLMLPKTCAYVWMLAMCLSL